jgi:molecular chaperone HscA
MALLQIAEPGESAAPHEHRLAVGIDLGTTNSLVATVRSGMSVVLNDERGRPLLPSIVRYAAGGEIEVGLRRTGPPGVRSAQYGGFGQTLHGPRAQGHRPRRNAALRFHRRRGHGQAETAQGIKSPVEVSAEVLKVCATGPRPRSAAN